MLSPKHNKIKYLVIFYLLCFCSSCSQQQVEVSTPARSQTTGSTSVPSLSLVNQAQTVEIHNDWNGYSDITPVLRRYRLRRQNRELVGNAHFAIGGYGAANIRQQRTQRVKIPATNTQKFLAALAKTPIKVGKYKPLIKHSDDYPSILIRLQIDKQEVIFSSQSQGKDRIPWKVAISSPNRTNEYVTNSPLPAQALRSLDRYINNLAIEQIVERKRKK